MKLMMTLWPLALRSAIGATLSVLAALSAAAQVRPVATASYQVLRAPNSTTAGTVIGTVPATTLTYVDRGFTASAVCQVVAVDADKRTAASAAVSYTPTIATTNVTPVAAGSVNGYVTVKAP